MDGNDGRVEIAKYFSDICRNSGKVSFKVTYTATDGNILTDKEFQEFCFKYANNEYLSGINLLLNVFKHYEEFKSLSLYVEQVDNRLKIVEDKIDSVKKEDKKEVKTFG